MSDSSVIVRSATPLTAPVHDDLVMLDPDRGEYFGLNEVGARIWTILAAPTSVGELCARLTAEYDVDSEECRRSVLAFLDELVAARLVGPGP